MIKQLVSIIITFYNEEILISRCLKSVLEQTYSNIELILINDGSTDNSLSIVEQYLANIQNSKIVTIPNSGHANARNIGLEMSTGFYVTFLDADDEFEPNAIEILLNEIKKNDADLAVCRFSVVSRLGVTDFISGWKDYCQEYKYSKDLVPAMFNYGVSENVWAKLFKSAIAKKIKFESNLWFDDRPYFLEYLFVAKTVCFIENSLLKIHKRDNSITRRTLEVKRIVDMDRVFWLEQNLIEKYSKSDKVLRSQVVKNHIRSLFDAYILQILEQDKIDNLLEIRATLATYIEKFMAFTKNEPLNLKDIILLRLLSSYKFLGWVNGNILIKNLRKERYESIQKFK